MQLCVFNPQTTYIDVVDSAVLGVPSVTATAAVYIPAGSLVSITQTDGVQAVILADSEANIPAVGFTTVSVNEGDQVTVSLTGVCSVAPVGSLSDANVGQPIYLAASGGISLAAGTLSQIVGILVGTGAQYASFSFVDDIGTAGGGGGSGSVTRVALTVPSHMSVSGSPITSSGTFAVTENVQAANTFFRGPNSGASATPSFGPLIPADLPVSTTSLLGAVKPDGTTISVTNGVISTVSANPTGSAGGDLSGSYPNPSVVRINGVSPAASATTDTTNAANITSGTLPSARLPLASSSVFGGVKVDGTTIVSTSGVISVVSAPPTGTAGGDLSGSYPNPTVLKTNGVSFAPSATTDTTNAANITSGTVNINRLPVATGSVLGTVKPDGTTITISSGVLTAFASAPSGTASGDLSGTYPAPTVAKINGLTPAPSATTDTTNASNISSGTLPSAQLPVATSSAIGGVKVDGTTITITSGVITAVRAAPSGVAGGDLSGSFPNPSVAKVNGSSIPVSAGLLGTNSSSQIISVTTIPVAAPSSGQILVGNAGGSAYAAVPVSGDATLSSAGALTVSKTNGVPFAASATTDTTNASNISSGTVAAARLPLATGAAFGAVKPDGTTITISSGVITAIGAAPSGVAGGDLGGSFPNPSVVKVNGGTVPASAALVGTNSSNQIIAVATIPVAPPSAGQLLIGNAGATAYAATAVSGDATLASTGALTVTKTSGVSFAASATTDTTNASNISSGTLPAARLTTASTTVLGGVKVDGTTITIASGVISASTIPSGTAGGDLSGSFPNPGVAKVNGASLPLSAALVGTNSSNQIIAVTTIPVAAPSAGQLLIGNVGGTAYAAVSMSGDATVASTGAITVTKTNGVSFAASATTDTTNASNISSGTLGAARLPLATALAFGAVKVDGTTITATAGVITAVGAPPTGSASGDLSGSFPSPTVAKVNGGSIPASAALVGTNSSNQIIAVSTIPVAAPAAGALLIGNVGGTAYASTAVSGDATLSSTGVLTVSKTGGAAFAASATTDTTNASNIATGTLGAARLPLATSSAFGGVKVDGTTITASAGVISAATATGSTLGVVKPDGTTITISAGVITAIGAAPSGVAGGDLSGTFPNPNVAKVNGGSIPLSAALVGTNASNQIVAVATIPVAAPTAGQVLVGNAGATAYAAASISGDATLASTGVITVTKTSGVAFAASATTDTTNATNISSGTLAAGRMPAFTGDVTTSAGSTAASVVKVNGAVVPTSAALVATNASNQLVAVTTIPTAAPASGKILIGNTGGTAYAANSVSGDATLTFAGALTVTKTNGVSFAASATTDTTVATNITSGTLPAAQLPLGSSLAFGALKVDGTTIVATSGVISAAGAPPTGTAGGDLSGSYPSPTVAKVNGAVVPTSAALVATNASNQLVAVTTIPTAAPASGKILIGNTGGTAYAANSMSGDATMTFAGVVTVAKVNGGTFPVSAGILGTNSSSQVIAVTTIPVAAPSAGQLMVGNAGGTAYAAVALSGDATLASTGAITVTKTNGVSFAASATTDTTNATNLTSGTVAAARFPALTGDVTTTTGTVATSVVKVNGASLPLSASIVGTNSSNQIVAVTTIPVAAPAAGAILIGNAGATAYAANAVSGDATLASTGALTVTKTSGVSFAASATTDTTNAANISSGTLPAARLPLATSLAFGAVKVDGTTIIATSGVISAVGAPPTGTAGGDLSGSFPNPTVAKVNGASIPGSAALVGTNSSNQIIAVSTIPVAAPAAGNILIGNTGGTAYAANAVSGDATLAFTGALTVTKTSGVAFAASATTDTTNASNISSGTLPSARLPLATTSVVGGVKPDGTTITAASGVLTGLACSSAVALAPSVGGNFTVAHGLGKTPKAVIIEMTSSGAIWFQSGTSYDSTNLYLVASDVSLTANAKLIY